MCLCERKQLVFYMNYGALTSGEWSRIDVYVHRKMEERKSYKISKAYGAVIV